MANVLYLSSDSPASRLYPSLTGEERLAIDDALDYIRDFPFEHGDVITKRLLPPVMVYEYADGNWRISYSLSFLPSDASYSIDIWAIARTSRVQGPCGKIGPQ